jgi:hypothetical protein
MFEIAENADRVGDDLVGFPALDVGDETDAAGILFLAEVVKAFRRRTPSMFVARMFVRRMLVKRVFATCVLMRGLKWFRDRIRCQ